MSKAIIVIGGGPAGYVAAIRAAQLGAKVTLIEKYSVGGTCLHWGCIPTKTLLRTAEVYHLVKHASDFGIEAEVGGIKVDVMHHRKQCITCALEKGIHQLLKGNCVEVIHGTASFVSDKTLSVADAKGEVQHVSGDYIILATGSVSSLPPIQGIDLPGVLTSNDMLHFQSIPKSLAIIGGGFIGLEFASLFSTLGSQVTVIENLSQVLPHVDSDLVKRFLPMMKKKGIQFYTSSKVNSILQSDTELTVSVDTPKGPIEINSAQVLVATGRKPYTEGLSLSAMQINMNGSSIAVNENFETSVAGVYAIGDVNGKSMLAHAASHQGIIAVEHIFGISHNTNMVVPCCIYTLPEIAFVGMTEDEAKEQRISYQVSKFLFGANGKALAMGEGEGMVKVISDQHTKKIIGVHMMGPHATDLISEGVLAITKGFTPQDLAPVIHAHPTLSEVFYEAVLGLDKIGIHMVNR